jgi:hypothetical protein
LQRELKLQLELLKDSPSEDDTVVDADSHELRTAPIFTREALEEVEWTSNAPRQFGLLGRTLCISCVQRTSSVVIPSQAHLDAALKLN